MPDYAPIICNSRFELEAGWLLDCVLEDGHPGYHRPDPNSGAGHEHVGWTDSLQHVTV